MNVVDLVIILVAGLVAWWGARTGFSLQAGSMLGTLVGLAAGSWVAASVADEVTSEVGRAMVVAVILMALAMAGGFLGASLGLQLQRIAGRAHLSVVDRTLGAVAGVAGVLLVVWLLGTSLARVPDSTLAAALRESTIVQALDEWLPPPPDVSEELAQVLDPLGFPQVFADLGVVPAEPVTDPLPADVQAAADAAGPSTVKVLGDGCGGVEGSAAVVGQDLVATNAHVVAGTGEQQVVVGDDRLAASVVAFDPRIDLAVLRVPGLSRPPLALAAAPSERGDPGAVLGYPGDGPLTVSSAAVRDRIRALGRDIYGDALVEREVYELQAIVRPGNSGGPFVLPDGTMAGLVFASSVSDPNVGYALTAAQVRPAIEAAAAATAAVPTGACVG